MVLRWATWWPFTRHIARMLHRDNRGPGWSMNPVLPVAWRRRMPAFTLIELLCVMAIIAILAGLLLGPAGRILGRARAMQWADHASAQTEAIRSQLHKILGGQKEFAQLSLGTLESTGWISAAQSRFLRDRRVHFTPFAGSDPDTLPVIVVEIKPGFLTSEGAITVTKGELTASPD